MKSIAYLISMFFLLGFTGGCSTKKTALNPSGGKEIAVLTMNVNLPDQTADQSRELKITLEWMNRDLIKNLNDSGFDALLIKEMQDYKPEMGKLLVIDVQRFKAYNRAAIAFVGFGAGSASLALNYKLLDEKGVLLAEWRDGVGSNKGVMDCAEILNRKVLENVVNLSHNSALIAK
jgi:hypothetical protein